MANYNKIAKPGIDNRYRGGFYGPSSSDIRKDSVETETKNTGSNRSLSGVQNRINDAIGKISKGEYANKMKLAAARTGASKNDVKRVANAGKALAKESTKFGGVALALGKQIDILFDWMILLPLTFAIIKDILDYIGFSLPGINEVFNFSISALLVIILAVLGSKQSKSFIKFLVAIAGFLCEEIFGLNFLPAQTTAVVVSYIFALMERLEAQQEQKKLSKEEGEEY